MKVVATAVEDGRAIALRTDGARWDVVVGNVVLLSSAALETERTFGALPRALGGRAPRAVLVGGLGFGATVRGVLEGLAPAADGGRVIVVEKVAAVRAFARGEAAHLLEGALDDPRVELVAEDVADAIASASGLDAILLDVDNGPEWASFRTNARLYAPAGLAAARAALRPGGLLAVWSGYPADAFVPRLRAAGFQPSVVPLTERGVVRARAYVGVAAG